VIPSRLPEPPHRRGDGWMHPCQIVFIDPHGFARFITVGYAPTFAGVARIRSFLLGPEIA